MFIEKKKLLDFDKRTFKNRKTSWKKTNFSVFVFKASFENTVDILIKVNDEFKDLKKRVEELELIQLWFTAKILLLYLVLILLSTIIIFLIVFNGN